MGPELHDAIEPRPDVLSDVLSEALADAVCAASLDGVVSGAAPDAYGKPANLFAATSPSADLRSLLDEVLGRVGGLSAGQRPARSAPQSERRSRPAPGRGAGTGAQLAKLLSVLPPSTPGPVITDARRAGVALAAPGHRFEATFVGAPADYRPLRPGLDHVLGQHDATVKASVTAAFADPRPGRPRVRRDPAAALKTPARPSARSPSPRSLHDRPSRPVRRALTGAAS